MIFWVMKKCMSLNISIAILLQFYVYWTLVSLQYKYLNVTVAKASNYKGIFQKRANYLNIG